MSTIAPASGIVPSAPPSSPAPSGGGPSSAPMRVVGDIPTMPIYQLSVNQYLEMAKHGILGPEDRVELINGWLVPKMSKNEPHVAATGMLFDVLPIHFPPGWHIRIQDPVQLATSVPEPDGAVVRGTRRHYVLTGLHPVARDTALVVEVADSSLDTDRTIKGPMYAEANIPIYWIVNLVDNVIEVYTDPSGPTAQPGYATKKIYQAGDQIPLVIAGQQIALILAQELLL